MKIWVLDVSKVVLLRGLAIRQVLLKRSSVPCEYDHHGVASLKVITTTIGWPVSKVITIWT